MTKPQIKEVIEGLIFISDRVIARQAYELITKLSDDGRSRLRSRVRSVLEEGKYDEGKEPGCG